MRVETVPSRPRLDFFTACFVAANPVVLIDTTKSAIRNRDILFIFSSPFKINQYPGRAYLLPCPLCNCSIILPTFQEPAFWLGGYSCMVMMNFDSSPATGGKMNPVRSIHQSL